MVKRSGLLRNCRGRGVTAVAVLRRLKKTAAAGCVVATVERRGCDHFLGVRWFPDNYSGKRAVVCGHWQNAAVDENGWPRPRVLSNRTYGIDTIFKGVLSAMRFPAVKIFQSRKTVTPTQ